MSEPKLTADSSTLTREDAINLIISSIAMEEIGLSHIINAEGEKLQYVLGTLDGAQKLDEPITVDELLKLNKSIRSTLEGAMKNQMLLGTKLQSALNSPVIKGDKGDVGTILGSYDTFDDLMQAHPSGKQGDAYLVSGELYVWNVAQSAWQSVGNLVGPPGPQGATGPRGIDGERGPIGEQGEQGIQGVAGVVGTIKGSYDSEEQLRAAHPQGGEAGDFYYINPYLFVWDEDNGDWINVGQIAGPQGIQGIQGIQGERGEAGAKGDVGTILGSYPTYDELVNQHPTGNQGDAFLVDGSLYVWSEIDQRWQNVGNLRGPQGPAGSLEPGQSLFTISDASSSQIVGCETNVEFSSQTLNIAVESGVKVQIEQPYTIGTFIPFNSGALFTLTTGLSGEPYRKILVGRGQTIHVNTTTSQISTSNLDEHSIIMPASAVATSLAVFFKLTTNTGLIGSASTHITAQIYLAQNSSNIFYPIDNAKLTFSIPFNAPTLSTYKASASFQAPLNPLDRILLVLSSTSAPEYTLGSTIGGELTASLLLK